MPLLEIKIAKSIINVDPEYWSDLDIQSPLNQYGWFRTLEECHLGFKDRRYFLCFDEGKILGVAVCFLRTTSSFVEDAIRIKIVKRLVTLVLRFLGIRNVLVCGHPKGVAKSIIFRPSLEINTERYILDFLFAEMKRFARERKAIIKFSKIPEYDESIRHYLESQNLQKSFSYPGTAISIQWNSFEEFKKYIKLKLGKSYKDSIVREINYNKKKGIQYEFTEKIEPHDFILHNLLKKNHLKYNRSEFPYASDFLKKVKMNLGDNAFIQVAKKEDKIFGVLFGLSLSDSLYPLMVGIDHAISGNDMTYFNLTFYNQIKLAIARRQSILYLGNMKYKAKSSRGAELYATYSFYWMPGRVVCRLAKLFFSYRFRRSKFDKQGAKLLI